MTVDALFYDATPALIDAENPLTFGPLNADESEVSAWKLVTVKMPAGYVTTGDTILDVTGDTDAKFQIAPASDGTGASEYGAPLTVSDPIDATTGVAVYVRAKAEGEGASNDASCVLTAAGTALAV